MQREFVKDTDVFGSIVPGTASEPGIVARSVHQLMKTVAGVPLRRPAWFFDISELGDALADVGTHVVDLAQWTVFPDQLIDYHQDIQVLERKRWPLTMTEAQYRQVTGEAPPQAGNFDYYCNNSVHYTLRGVHVKLEITWNWEAPPGGGDIYEARFRGTKSRIEIRQPDTGRPELYVVPLAGPVAVHERIAALQSRWPGLRAIEANGEYHIAVPDQFRVGHEAHFAQVAKHFLKYVQSPGTLPAWERAFMLAKYAATTGAGQS
jgi:predicted dehydrogenase